MVSILNSYVFVCPECGQEFDNLQDYLEYSEGERDYLITDNLGCSYLFDSIEDYQEWVRDELIAVGKTLYEWKIEQQNLSMETNKTDEIIRIFLQLSTGRRLFRFASRRIRKFSRKAKFAREIALT